MKYIVNSKEMQRYDANTSECFKIPSIVLMERAAVAFVEELKQQGTDLSRVLVVCGNGNNGGDGLAIARLLSLEGCKTDIVMPQKGKSASAQNKTQQEILAAYGFEILEEIPAQTEYTAVIDAIFGVGLSRKIEGVFADILSQMNQLKGKKIAADIASGISADDGAVLGVAFRADMTITFAYAKCGMLLWPGNEYSGTVIVKEIGIDGRSFLGEIPAVAALEDSDLWQLPQRNSHSNKGTYGKLLVIAGSVSMAGAACLCAKAAYATGCGLVRVVTPEENRIILQCAVPEAILTTYDVAAPDLGRIREALAWADAVVLGPGIGMSDASRRILELTLKETKVPLLLDADALNLIAENVSVLDFQKQQNTTLPCGTNDSHHARKESQGAGWILTPHLGEMSRLAKCPVSQIQTQLIQTAQSFATAHHVICVLKDEHTITAIPQRQTYLNLSGNSGMATAGSGDVLSGIIGSLLAQGMAPELAAPYGVYLHGRAGDCAAEKTGERGLLASDIIEGIRHFDCIITEHEK